MPRTIRFHLDENCHRAIAEGIRRRGIDVSTTPEARLLGALDDKLSILDIKARDQTGRQFNVEMQMLPFLHYGRRILYYACKLHQLQFHQGQDYHALRPTISISFLHHLWFPKIPDYYLCFRLLEQKHHFPLTGDLEFHILELPKFTKSLAELSSGLDFGFTFYAMRR